MRKYNEEKSMTKILDVGYLATVDDEKRVLDESQRIFQQLLQAAREVRRLEVLFIKLSLDADTFHVRSALH